MKLSSLIYIKKLFREECERRERIQRLWEKRLKKLREEGEPEDKEKLQEYREELTSCERYISEAGKRESEARDALTDVENAYISIVWKE